MVSTGIEKNYRVFGFLRLARIEVYPTQHVSRHRIMKYSVKRYTHIQMYIKALRQMEWQKGVEHGLFDLNQVFLLDNMSEQKNIINTNVAMQHQIFNKINLSTNNTCAVHNNVFRLRPLPDKSATVSCDFFFFHN